MMIKDYKQILSAVKAREQGRSFAEIAAKLGTPASTIKDWIRRTNLLGLTYANLRSLSGKELAEIYAPRSRGKNVEKFNPRWEEFVVRERGTGGNSDSLYREYLSQCPSVKEPLSRSAFYRELSKMREILGPTLQPITIANSFAPGHIAMIDYSGDGILIHDGQGKTSKAQIFVGVLANSGLIFCLATPTQKRMDWLAAIAAMFHFYGGVTDELWLDNSTSLVLKADKYAPKLSEEFKNFCEQYQTLGYAVAPGKPKHKALVENAVKQCQRSILAPLANRKFFSIEEANRAIEIKLEDLNTRPLSGLPNQTRQSRFNEHERELLNPLPHPEYIPNSWIVDRKISPSNQIRLVNARYSVPWGHAGEKVRIIGNNTTRKLSFFLLDTGEHLCDSKLRNAADGNEPTKKEHLPAQLQYMMEDKSDLLNRIGKTLGDRALTMALGIAKPNNSMAVRHLHGILAKAKFFSKEDFDEICQEVIGQKVMTFRSFQKACGKAELEGKLKVRRTRKTKPQHTDNRRFCESDLRGASYFKEKVDGSENDER